jgi:hypothetical protein
MAPPTFNDTANFCREMAREFLSIQGAPVNLVESYFWPELSAKTWGGSRQQDAVHTRALVAQHLTPADVTAAEDRAAKWLAARQQ